MKYFLLALAACFLLSAHAQQTLVQSGSGGYLILQHMDTISSTDQIMVGQVFGPPSWQITGVVMRQNSSGVVWAKTLAPGTNIVRTLRASNGDIIVVGSAEYMTNAFIARFDQNGTPLWMHVISTANAETFSAVTEGPTGILYAGGVHMHNSGSGLMFVTKLDPAGNVIWTREEAQQATSSSISDMFVSSDSLFVFGTEVFPNSNTDIGVRVLNATSGQEIMRRSFGHPSETDAEPRVVKIPGGFVVSRTGSPGLSSSVGIFRISSDLQLLGSGTSYGASGIEVARVSLAVSGSHAYLAMQAASPGATYTHAVKVSLVTFDLVWNSTMVSTAYPISATALGGSITIASSQTDPVPFSGVVSVAPLTSGVVPNPCVGLPQVTLEPQPYTIIAADPEVETWTMLPVAQTASFDMGDHDLLAIPCAVPLPVELVSFAANAANDRVELFWETATEIGSSHFLVERSSDGQMWTAITRVEAAGESQLLVTYSVFDSSPLSGRSFYRLQSVDSDGSSEYSDAVIVERAGVHAYPNPAVAGGEIRFPGRFTVVNMLGQVVHADMEESVTLQRGTYIFQSASNPPERVVVE